MLTRDGVDVGITSVYITLTMGGVFAGGLDFIWRSCVDEAPADIKREWPGPPVHMLRPPRPDPRRTRPPHWRIAVRLESGLLVEEHDPGEGEIEGSHLTLLFFRQEVFDLPLDDIVALAAAEVEWRKHARDWSW